MADNAKMQDLQQENRDLQKALQAIEAQLDATLGKFHYFSLNSNFSFHLQLKRTKLGNYMMSFALTLIK